MTYIYSINKRANAKCNIYYGASATIGTDEPITYSSQDTSLTTSFTLSKSGSQFTIPSDGAAYYLEASICYYYNGIAVNNHAIIQWYDITNSSYVGTKGIVTSGLNPAEGRSGEIVGDEAARFVTDQSNIYELRLLSYTGSLSDIDTPSSRLTSSNPFVQSRCLIWRYV